MQNRKPSWVTFALLCAVLIFAGVRNAVAQDRLSKLEWFIEGGGSFLNLGKQPNQVPISGTLSSGYLVSPDLFSSSALFFTGLRYHLTARDALEASYNTSVANYFTIQSSNAAVPQARTRFERYAWSFNYVRYIYERGGVRPFLTAGLGPTTLNSAAGWGRIDLSFNLGMGTDFRINDRLAFRMEVRDYIGFLPAPLRGASHDLAPIAGLVFSPPTSPHVPTRFPQVEVFLEGGTSVLTGGTGTLEGAVQVLANGQTAPDLGIVRTNSFSKSGRVVAGFRVAISKNNFVEFSNSQGPNRYSENEQRVPVTVPPNALPFNQVTLWAADFAANYVRYLPWGGSLKPFLTAGVGEAHFAGTLQDIDNFGWNVGAGADVPLWNRLAARFEIRDYMSRQPDLLNGIVHNIAPTVGLAYRFN